MKKRLCTLVALLVLMMHSVIAASKPVPVLTNVQAQQYLAQIKPLVEKFSGRRFLVSPHVKIATPEQVAAVLSKELVPQLKQTLPQMSEANRRSFAKKQAGVYSHFLLGKYGTSVQTLFIIPSNIRPRMKDTKVDSKYESDFIRLTIAHELTHALQDQYVGLARLLSIPKTMDQMLAASSTIEGQAIYVQDQVAEALGLEAANKEFARAIGAGAPEDPVGKLASATDAKLISDMYLAGRDFIAWHAKNNGAEQVWKIIARPPTKSGTILHPETYASTKTDSVDYEAVLNGIETQFAKRSWQVVNMEVGEMQIKAIYNGLDPKLCDAILQDYDHAQALAAVDVPTVVSVTLIILKSPRLFPELVSALEDFCKKNSEQINTSKDTKVLDLETGNFSGIKSTLARDIRFKVSSGGEAMSNRFVRVVRGRVMVEVYTQGIDIADSRLSSVVEHCFSKLPSDITAVAN